MIRLVIEMNDKKWYKSKTIWTAIATIIAELANVYFDLDIPAETIAVLGGSLMAISLRIAVGQNGKRKR